MVQIANAAEVPTVWDRYQAQQPQCKFGTDGVCCRLCHMGPCRITPKAKLGICGADADTITARNCCAKSPPARPPTPTMAACWYAR